jgi:hypothetical protein
MGGFFYASQDAEKVRQRRSRFAQTPTYPRGYASGPSLAAVLLGKRRVSARQGWAGERSGLFEHPA